jgi:hypothetical protein
MFATAIVCYQRAFRMGQRSTFGAMNVDASNRRRGVPSPMDQEELTLQYDYLRPAVFPWLWAAQRQVGCGPWWKGEPRPHLRAR